MGTTKVWYKSKTIIANIISLIIAIGLLINPAVLLAMGVLPENQSKVLTLIVFFIAVLNLILRMITDAPITITKPKNSDNV